MRKIVFSLLLLALSPSAFSNGYGLTIKDVYYCSDDFSMLMSNGERWVVKKSQVGEQKLNHFISIALYMAATGKRTKNIFPGEPENWCGNSNTRPIRYISFED